MPVFGLPDPSPFPIKVALFMKMHGIDYEAVPGDVRKAPKGKIPYIDHNGTTVSDSELILDYLSTELNIEPDDLSVEQHALGHALCRMLEERTYWGGLYYRWYFDEPFALLREKFFGVVPKLLRGLISSMVRKSMVKAMYAQGLTRHSENEIAEFLRRDLKALSQVLGDKPYLFGDKMTRYDCTALAFAAMISVEGLPTIMPDFRSEFVNLANYWDRNKTQFFPDPSAGL
jgi:glutathione S-transferase